MTDNVHILSTNIGALSSATRAIFKVPTGYGGITIKECKIIGAGAGTSWFTLCDLGTAGTAAGTVIGSGGTAVSVANVPQAVTLTDANVYVAEGHYVGIVENGVGAANAVTIVDVAFAWGK